MLHFLSLDIFLKFSKILILEFSDSPTQSLVLFLSRETGGRMTRTEYFLDGRLRPNVAKKVKKLALSKGFSHILHG